MRKAIYGGLAAALVLAGCGKFGSFLAPIKDGKDDKPHMDLVAKVRDFKEGNPTSPDGTHPHFNQGTAACEAHPAGIFTVLPALSTGGTKDSLFPGDERTPDLAPLDSMPANVSRCFTPPDRFSDWFEDRGQDVNRPFLYKMKFIQDDKTGFFEFKENRFFPLDKDQGAEKERKDGPDTFGYLQTGSKDGVDLSSHIYGFTLEFHVMFTYNQGKGQFLSLRGDDDLWAFVNGHRAIDLGGIHSAESDSVNLDDKASAFGLVDKGVYNLDFFFAERAVASSTLDIVTNLDFQPVKP
jgi:fibro-slime domain-containing protein